MGDHEDDLQAWIGREEIVIETLTPEPVVRLAALFDQSISVADRQALPPMWQWLYFLPHARQSELGPDGHPRRGGFLPPVPQRRRMFGGGRAWFVAPLRLGDAVRRVGTVQSVEQKKGSTGPLTFVTVRFEYAVGSAIAAIEEQDIVYRDGSGSVEGEPTGPIPKREWRATVRPDPVLLFRFSALTFNSHRIHYDRPHATRVEGYPSLVVQGPLVALLLLELCRQNSRNRPIAEFSFRARAPLFDTDDIVLVGEGMREGGGADLSAYSGQGRLAMTAAVKFST